MKLALHKKITVPTHYKECTTVQFEFAVQIMYSLQIKLGLKAEPAPLGQPNFKMVKMAKKEDFKPMPTDCDAIIVALADPCFVAAIAGFTNQSKEDVQMIVDLYDNSLYGISVAAASVLDSASVENLTNDGLQPVQGLVIYDDNTTYHLSMKETFEEYPADFIINAVLEPIEKEYDFRAFMTTYFAQMLRAEDDTEIVQKGNGQYEVNGKMIDRNIRLLQKHATMTDLLGLYLFFCTYTKIVNLYLGAHSAILQTAKALVMRQSILTS